MSSLTDPLLREGKDLETPPLVIEYSAPSPPTSAGSFHSGTCAQRSRTVRRMSEIMVPRSFSTSKLTAIVSFVDPFRTRLTKATKLVDYPGGLTTFRMVPGGMDCLIVFLVAECVSLLGCLVRLHWDR